MPASFYCPVGPPIYFHKVNLCKSTCGIASFEFGVVMSYVFCHQYYKIKIINYILVFVILK